MLPALLRYDLRHDPEFFERARAWHSPFWTILMSEAKAQDSSFPSPAPFQFAVIVKKTVASGVVRSELKRKVKQAIIDALPSPLPDFATPQAVVIIPRRKALGASTEDLYADLARFFSERQTEPIKVV